MNTVILMLITNTQYCEFTISQGLPSDPTPPTFVLINPPIVPVRGYSEPGGTLAPPSAEMRSIQFVSRPGGYGFGDFRISAGYVFLKSDGGRCNFQCAIQSPADVMALSFVSATGVGNTNPTYYWLWAPDGSLLQNSTINVGQKVVVPITSAGAKIKVG